MKINPNRFFVMGTPVFIATTLTSIMFILSSCGERKLDPKEACDYFVQIRDNYESVESKRLLRRFRNNIKNYNIEVMVSIGVRASAVEDRWELDPEGQLRTYGTQYFLEVCKGYQGY